MSDVAELMKRCQRGVGGCNALDEAHDIMAECYGTLGRLESELAALEAECERLADELDRKSVITGDYIARCQRLAAERDALAAELAAIKGQEPVAFYWQDIGYPEPHKHGPYFGWPRESALRNVDGRAIPVPLYALPAAPEGGEKA